MQKSKEIPSISKKIEGIMACHYEITIFGKRCNATGSGYVVPNCLN